MKNITDQTFKEETASGLVLVDFWATWCGPCKSLSPKLEKIDSENKGKDFQIKKIDVDQNPNTAGELGIRGIPTMILFKDGKEVERLVGNVPEENILELLRKNK